MAPDCPVTSTGPPAARPAAFPASRTTPLGRPYNVILVITDEEACQLRPAEGFATPARVSLKALLAAAPLDGIDLERSRDPGRDVDL